ncbi:hypothetical protein NN561_000249 [Cricetulus griseus]
MPNEQRGALDAWGRGAGRGSRRQRGKESWLAWRFKCGSVRSSATDPAPPGRILSGTVASNKERLGPALVLPRPCGSTSEDRGWAWGGSRAGTVITVGRMRAFPGARVFGRCVAGVDCAVLTREARVHGLLARPRFPCSAFLIFSWKRPYRRFWLPAGTEK